MSSVNHNKSGLQRVGIGIATYKRSVLLNNCLAALNRLDYPAGYDFHVIVVDNDAEGSARPVFAGWDSVVATAHYFIEPCRGIATARNAILDRARELHCDWLAFVDDDEWPATGWLAAHLDALARHDAVVAAGPVQQTLELSATPVPAGGQRHATGDTPRHIAAGNVVIHNKLFSADGLGFDPFYDHIGGEDFDFFNRSTALGNRHIWVAGAIVYEYLPASRRTLGYVLYRHFTGAINSVLRSRRDRGYVISWLRFLPKIAGKLLAAAVALIAACLYEHRQNFRACAKRAASAAGYVCGLCNIVFKRYKNTDGY